jgi:hypothetical protein
MGSVSTFEDRIAGSCAFQKRGKCLKIGDRLAAFLLGA